MQSTIRGRVVGLLEEIPKTRDSDYWLVYWYAVKFKGAFRVEMKEEGDDDPRKFTSSEWRSINRERQVVQKLYPHLKPSREEQVLREVKREECKERYSPGLYEDITGWKEVKLHGD